MDNNNCCGVIHQENGLENEGKDVIGPSEWRAPPQFTQSSLAVHVSDWFEGIVLLHCVYFVVLTCFCLQWCNRSPDMFPLLRMFYPSFMYFSILIMSIAPLSFESHHIGHLTPVQKIWSIALSRFLFFSFKLQIHRCQLVWVMKSVFSVDSLVSASRKCFPTGSWVQAFLNGLFLARPVGHSVMDVPLY